MDAKVLKPTHWKKGGTEPLFILDTLFILMQQNNMYKESIGERACVWEGSKP